MSGTGPIDPQKCMADVRGYATEFEAESWRTQLASEGISAVVYDASGTAYPGANFGRIRLQVNEEDLQLASDVIQRLEQDAKQRSPWQCERCNEPNESTFDFCYSCGKSRSDDSKAG
ncbi:MAG: hypothetical protein AAFP90_00575, partial [Planctomycetota bacterium]